VNVFHVSIFSCANDSLFGTTAAACEMKHESKTKFQHAHQNEQTTSEREREREKGEEEKMFFSEWW
jgi:hypothetical protein